MILSCPSFIQTRFSATSGSNHAGSVPEASISRNSPSVSVTLTHAFGNCFESSRSSQTTTHSSSIESPYSVCPRREFSPAESQPNFNCSLPRVRTSPFSETSSRLNVCRCQMYSFNHCFCTVVACFWISRRALRSSEEFFESSLASIKYSVYSMQSSGKVGFGIGRKVEFSQAMSSSCESMALILFCSSTYCSWVHDHLDSVSMSVHWSSDFNSQKFLLVVPTPLAKLDQK